VLVGGGGDVLQHQGVQGEVRRLGIEEQTTNDQSSLGEGVGDGGGFKSHERRRSLAVGGGGGQNIVGG
jgi:hypothetical protein